MSEPAQQSARPGVFTCPPLSLNSGLAVLRPMALQVRERLMPVAAITPSAGMVTAGYRWQAVVARSRAGQAVWRKEWPNR